MINVFGITFQKRERILLLSQDMSVKVAITACHKTVFTNFFHGTPLLLQGVGVACFNKLNVQCIFGDFCLCGICSG